MTYVYVTGKFMNEFKYSKRPWTNEASAFMKLSEQVTVMLLLKNSFMMSRKRTS
jgi:hypothetical protein